MRVKRLLFGLLLPAAAAWCATFGTVVTRSEKLSDIVLDEARRRLYLVDATANTIDIYNVAVTPPRSVGSIKVNPVPSAAALSRDGKYLYVTCYDSSTLDVVDLDRQTVVHIVLDAKPEGVAVGAMGNEDRVLIGTVGTGNGQAALIIYNPKADAAHSKTNVLISPGATPVPTTPPPNSNEFLKLNGRLLASADGRLIVGVNNTSNLRSRSVFVFDVPSGTVLASRTVNNASTVLAISPDGSRFMAGPTMFDTATLSVLAQQNAANAPFVFPSGNSSNFNLNSIQGGSVFSPDGQYLYSAFDIPPVQSPAAASNVSQLLVNDPENMLIQVGIKMTENLNGKMVINSEGSMIYALSQSGFLVLPVGNLRQSPLAMPRENVLLLVNDQCGVNAARQSASVPVENVGGGPRMTVSASLLQVPNSGPIGLGGTGAGGGGGGGLIQILLPPVVSGPTGPIGVPGFGTGGIGNTQAAVIQTSPQVRTQPQGNGAMVSYFYNPLAARAPGTVAPHDFLIQSNEAINIPPVVRVYQNNRNAEAKGTVIPVSIGVSNSEGLVDMVTDTVRQRLYIANSGLNRVEVFDMREQKFLNPIRVGQLPRSLALDGDGVTLYVANNGAEAISIVDLEKLQQVGRITFPPIPFNASYALVTPAVIAWSVRGLQVVMSDGTLWKVVGNQMVPRTLNPSVFGTARTISGPLRTMASTPEGRYVLLLAGNGMAYLYDAQYDDYIRAAQVSSTPIQGFFGPIAAGPNGNYFLVNGNILNLALTVVGSAPTVTVGPTGPDTPVGPVPMPLPSNFPTRGNTSTTVSRPVSAVAAAGPNQFVRFSGPIRTSTTQLAADAGVLELVDVATRQTVTYVAALEGPLATQVGTQRTNINGRTLAVNASGNTVYALTTAGLSILPMDRQPARDVPSINRNGVVSTANYTASFAPNSLISVFGGSLGAQATASAPLPNMLGGMCVTLDNAPLPLLLTSGTQINAQLPPTTTAGRHSLVLRAIDRQAASEAATITVSKYAPAVFLGTDGTPSIFHADGEPVSKDRPAKRDEKLTILASGLGATKGGRVTAGAASPSNPLAVTDKVQVFFGNPGYREAEQIVEWSGLVPGYVGVYQINVRVPGARIRGEKLPVQIRIGGVNSPTTGPAAVFVAVE